MNRYKIINNFIEREVEAIYKKYNNIDDEEINLISSLIEKLERLEIDYDPYKDYEKTKELAKALKDKDNPDVINLCIFLTQNLELLLSLNEEEEIHNYLQDYGYVVVDQYLLYYKHSEETLRNLIIEALTEELEDVERVLELFNEEEIAHMWIFNISMKDAAEQYVRDNEWEEVLEAKDIEVAYLDRNKVPVYYSRIERGDILE